MNKRTEQTRWTPKRLLSLLMALIMTLSLLPTAALAAASSDDKYTLVVDDAPGQLITQQESADITATLSSTDDTPENVRLKVTVNPATGAEIKRYDTATSTYVTTNGYLDDGTVPISVSNANPVSADFKLSFNAAGSYEVKVEAVSVDTTGAETGSLVSETKTIVVKDAIESLTVIPDKPEAGQPFTVRADTNVNSGNVVFEYNSVQVSAPVKPLLDNKGYAEYTFIANTGATGDTAISATLFDTTGILGTKTTGLALATPAAYHTVVFRANGDNVYSLPAPQPVKSGEMAAEPIAPERKGYTFGGWYKDAACTNTAKYTFADPVTKNLELYAKWEAKQVKVIANTPTVASAVKVFFVATTPLTTTVTQHIGANVTFYVTVPAEYDPSTILAYAGYGYTNYKDLAPVAQSELRDSTTGNVTAVKFQYQFELTENLVDPTTNNVYVGVYDTVASKTFTVMMPTGHFDAKITSVDSVGSTMATGGKSASIVYGGGYTFTVTPDKGYTVKRVAVNGATINKNNDGSYTVPDVTTAQMVEVVVDELPVYIVIYNSNNSQYAFQRVTEGSKATLPADPVVEGYTFGGWYTKQNGEGEQFTDTTAITGDITVYAKLTAKTYQISYNANTTDTVTNMPTVNPLSKTHGLAEKLSETVPTREGYTFLGWGTTDKATAASYQPGDMYSVDKEITLYAVWQKNTYTITLPSGTGYSISYSQSTSVAHGEGFEFTITVDGDYAANVPTVSISDPAHGTLEFSGSGNYLHQPGVYHCKITNVTGNQIVSVSATENERVEVTFSYRVVDKDGNELPSDALSGSIYSYQSVQIGDPASQPELPKLEGYRFVRWSVEQEAEGVVSYPAYTFVDPVMGPMTVYAEMTPITPVVTWPAANEQIGYRIFFINPASLLNVSGNSGTVAYKDTVRFYVMIKPGYDASNIQVGINGQLYTPVSTDGSVYTYEFSAKEDLNKITVVGIGRKDVKVTYYANATDDVEHIPGQQILKYYLPNAADNGTLDKATPKRVGYVFKGWSTDPTDSPDAANLYQPGGAHNFVTDTNLYAIWKATSTTVTLKVSGLRKDSNDNEGQYEGKDITLTAEIEKTGLGTPGGSMRFYKKTIDGTTVLIETVPVTGENVTLTTPVGEFFNTSNWSETYWVEYFPEEGKGFATSKSNEVAVRVWSAAISWSISGTKIASNGDVLKVYQNTKNNETNAPGAEIADGTMIAGNVYWLEIPKVLALNGGNDPTIGHGYEILWQFMDDSGSWRDYTTTKDSNMVMIDADHSRYSFRANVVPTDPFTKAVDYKADGSLIDNQYNNAGLYTKQTKYVALQKTNTALEVTNAENELASVKINGATSFTKDHLAQFEGQAVTLTAKVTKDGGTGVETGKVSFYRLASTDATGAQTWELISTVDVQTAGDNTGVASTTYTMGTYDSTSAGASATTNKETFKAVYVANETYATSTTDGNAAVYIKSAKLMTPVIESELEGTNGAKATTYSKDLTGLLAGVQHEFKLRQDADQTTKDYSVVALDGRTVAAKNYDIKWLKTTGSNEQEVDATGTNQIKVDENKVDDRYRVKLTGKGVFAGSEATSKDAVIGTKQDVTVTVKAIDAITKTPETDVYQLNEITLTATVAAANDKPTMQPTGTVTFYYLEEGATNKWIELGTSTLTKDAQSTQGEMIATIQTTKLPVAKTTYTSLPSKITAVYSGDDTFQQNQTFTKDTASTKDLVFGTIANVNGNTTNNVEVTVRSSVVKGCADANKAVTTLSDTGIHISADGLAAHEGLVTLKLDEVYTLDAKKAYSKLLAGTDYTVQWQILSGASAYNNGGDYSSADAWVNIDGATDTTYTLTTVAQDAAYRAVITVANEPITKGSFTKIRQDATDDLLNGHKQYYSNVLCAADGQTTIDVLIDTNGRGTNKEGITEGETVNVNVFLSGATQATPIADVTVKIENDTAKGNNETYSTTLTGSTVNGWNVFPWNTVGVAPGFYKVTVSSKSNTGYADETVTRSLIVRESSYNIEVGNTNPTYNGHTQGLTVTLDGFDFKGTGINEAANKSWTVKYYVQKVEGLETGALVEPTQAGTYKAIVTLPASAYWTEQSIETPFTIEKRSVSIADAIAQAKVYDGTTDVNIVEVMLNDAETEQGTTGWLKSGENTGIINGDSIYAVATAASLNSANAGNNSFKISTIELRGDDANNYEWDKASYTENIYVSRSQVYGETGTLKLKQGETFPADKVIKMIDQSGREITLGTGTEDYTLTFYYHSDTKIEKTTDISKLGLYTVVARPNQSNYKSGVTMQFTVVETATVPTPATTPKASTLITISNTAELYGAAGNNGIQTSFTNSATLTKLEYQVGTGWTATAPTDAGRYLVKVTASTGDVAYGIYTITKAHPSIDVTPATGLTYNSMPQNGYTTLTGVEGKDASKDYYITYAGDVAIGYNTPADGNVDEQAPVDAGTYTVTLHVNETTNYTAHEISKSFTIAKKALTIKAKHVGAWQYGSMPGFYASYEGLAGDVNDSTPDTSLRDVQIAPELLFNPTSNNQSNYSNDALDQVGKIIIRPVDALSKNYELTPVDGEFTKNEEDPKPTLTILGLPQNGKSADVTVYYGDEIQLSAYGNYLARRNTSSFLKWEITNSTLTNGSVSIDENNILHVNGVGIFTVKLTRGTARQAITTEITVTAIQKEAKIALKNVDKVYTGASQTYDYTGNVTVHDELYHPIGNFVDSKLTRTNTARIDVGTQVTTAKVDGAWAYQSETYGGKFTINDKDATVAPVAQSTVYGTLETFDTTPTYKVDGKAGSVDPVTGVNVASQTDAYNRLDVHDGYEILVAGTENMNYNVKYTTDETAEDSAVTTYQDVVFTSKTDKYLNDATIYGETPNVLDWTLVNVIGATRDSVDYADNLADFDLPTTFVEQDKDDCTGNKVTYKAANRTTEISGSTVEYNQAALTGPRTSTDTATDENYTLKFNTVENSGKALLANNYKLTNVKTGNSATTTNALTANSKGFIPAAGESNDVSGENFVEGSANIAQRPIKLEKAVTDAQLYWRLPQSQLYTALVNILKAEENSVGRGLAKGHTIEDLDLSFTIGSTPVDKNDDQPMTGLTVGTQTVTVTVGDTNYKLEGSNTFEVDFQTMRIRATYYNKTFTGFDVRIEKIDAAGNSVGPLDSTKGLTFKVLKQTNGVLDTETDYAANKSFTFVSKDGTYGYFHGSYSQLPLLGNGELYVFQMYEYGVPLERK